MEPVSSLDRTGGEDGRQIVLALNSGSSSVKFGSYDVGAASADLLVESAFEGADTGPAVFDHIGEVLAAARHPPPTAIGHRIVHGGPDLQAHCLIDEAVVHRLEAAVPFAPLHLPASLALIRCARDRYPHLPQIACFDTAFHATLPEIAYTLPIAHDLCAGGIRRYGFHGLSCESIVRQLGADIPDRLVIAHLGNGASVTAVRAGVSIDTSMGLTPSGGVMMGSRSGDLDPGVLIYLMRERGMDAHALEALVDRKAGLLGVSGIASDMRALHASSDPRAALAVAMFCRSVSKEIGAMSAVLGGIDGLVFTGGIGEHDDLVRSRIWADLAWMAPGDAVQVFTSREDEQIARHTRAILSGVSGAITCFPIADHPTSVG
jgi:acetate kinase